MQVPGTLEDAVKYAKQAELVVKIEAGDSSVFEQDKAQIQNQIRIQKELNKGPVNTQEIDELAAQMEKLKLAMIGISRQQNVQPRNNYPNYRPMNNYPNYMSNRIIVNYVVIVIDSDIVNENVLENIYAQIVM